MNIQANALNYIDMGLLVFYFNDEFASCELSVLFFMMMLTRLARSLIRTHRLYYSTMEKKNVIVVPKTYQLNYIQFESLVSEIQRSPTCKVLAALIKGNLQLFSDYHIGALFNQIGRYDLVVDDHFHTVIAPIAVEWVKTFNRQNASALCSILLTLTLRNISSPELEQIVLKKLDEENIYRYLDLTQTAAVFNSLSKHKRFLKHPLFTKIQKVIFEQKAYYSHHPNLLKTIREGMDAVEREESERAPQIQAAHRQIV